MSFLSSILAIFGKKEAPVAAPAAQGNSKNTVSSAPVPKKNKNVYDEARRVPVPEWAQGLSTTDLPMQLREHVKCKYMPNFGMKTIMTTKQGPDGNLIPEYKGIAGDCGAIKEVGRKVAARDGRSMPYKYVDLNMAFRCCCDIPTKCPFYLAATGEAERVNSRRN